MVSWVEQSLSQSGEGGTCPKGVGRNHTGNSLRVGAGPGGMEEPCRAQFSEEGSLGGWWGPSLGRTGLKKWHRHHPEAEPLPVFILPAPQEDVGSLSPHRPWKRLTVSKGTSQRLMVTDKLWLGSANIRQDTHRANWVRTQRNGTALELT